MGSLKVFRGIFITLTLYLLLVHGQNLVLGAPSSGTGIETPHRARGRTFLRFPSRPANQYARIKSEGFSDLLEDDDLFDMAKRQASDDYGHLRFGKREDFDDYGHMRFGRSGSE